MPRKTGLGRQFSLLAATLLLLQLFSPFALADGAEARENNVVFQVAPYGGENQGNGLNKVIGFDKKIIDFDAGSARHQTLSTISLQSAASCELKEVTAAQYKRFVDSVFNSGAGGKFTPFEGKEITDRPDASLKALPPANAQNINVNVYNFPAEESTQFLTAREFAQLASAPSGKSVNNVLADIDKELGVGPEEQLSIAQARSLASKKGYGNSLQGALNGLVSSRKAGKPSEDVVPGFEALKVRLPTGVEMPVGELMRVPAIAKRFGEDKSCLLNDASVTGKLSYRALLDRDLTIAGDRAEVAKDAESQDKQHVNTDGFRASFQNYDGHLVIPRLFEKAVGVIKKLNYLDIVLSTGLAIYSLNSVRTAEGKIATAEKFKLEKSGFVVTSLPEEVRTPFGSPIVDEVKSYYAKAAIKGERMKVPPQLEPHLPPGAGGLREQFESLTDPNAQLKFLKDKLGGSPALTATITKLEKDSTGKFVKKDFDVPLFSDGTTTAVRQEFESLKSDKTGQYYTELAQELKEAGRLSYVRAWNSIVMGAAWLGPARLGLELAGQFFFTSVGDPSKSLGTRLVVFVSNNNIAEEFRRGTDFVMSGRAQELISDLTASGIPSKVFSTDRVQLIQTMGDSGKEKLSRTVFKFQDQSWLIQPTWFDHSDAIMFEDVRDGKKISSMAVEVNYTKWSVGLNRRKEYAAYYGALVAFAPLFGWVFHRVADFPTSLVTIARLIVLDLFIDNFIDPNKFSDKEICKDEDLNYYIHWYEVMIAGGVAEQFILLPAFGNYVKGIQALTSVTASPLAKKVYNAYANVALVDPVGIAKAYFAGLALQYASTCKDSQYKILAFQRLPEKVPQSALKKVQEKTTDAVGLGDVMKGLNIGKSLETFVGKQLKAQDLKEILNLKVLMQNQNGQVRPAEIYEVHIEPRAELSKVGAYGPEAGCFRNCLVDKGGKFICLDDQRGVYDEKGVIIPDKDFALNSYFIPKLGNVIPTKIIVAPFDCGGGLFSSTRVFAEARAGDASVTMVDASCSATDCLKSKLAQVTGFSKGDALSDPDWLGNLKAVHSTLGTASVHQGEFKFLYKTGVQSEGTVIGKVVGNIPLVDDGEKKIEEKGGEGDSTLRRKEFSLAGVERRLGELDVMGDAKVRAKGADGSKPEDELGELRTLEFENGVIHYDPAAKRLVAIIHKLAEIPAAYIKTLGGQPAVAESPKKALEKEKSEVDALKAALQANQKLSDKQLDLLKRLLEKIASGKDAFTADELAKLREAMKKRAEGKPLSPEEKRLVDKAEAQPIFPGVVVVPQEKIERIGNALKDGGVDAAKAEEIKKKLENQQPLSLAEKKEAEKAVDAAKASGKISAGEAEDLKKAVDGATAPSERAKELADAIASGRALTPQQDELKKQLLNQIGSEQTRLASEIASAPAVDIPGIKLGPVVAKPGQEDNARKLNAALEKLGTLTDFSTEKHAISFGSDDKGNAVVKIGNKETGAFDSLRITGPPTRDGNAIVFPTDKGPLRFEFSMDPDSGSPIITVNGPGINERSPLLIAQGKDGFIWFDPATGQWRVGPGLVVPTDELFGKTGAQFQGSADGTRGFPQEDKFTPPRVAGETSVSLPGANPLLSLPSWPENAFGIIAMLLAVLAGVLVARVAYGKRG